MSEAADTKDRRLRLLEILKNNEFDDSLEGRYYTSQRKKILYILILIVVIFFTSVIALSIGAVDIPLTETLKAIGHALFPWWIGNPSESYYSTILFKGRLPRICLTILTGVSLAAAGQIMQGILRNPLVSPFTLGVSTAASFGAAMSIVFGAAIFGSVYYMTFTIGSMTMNISDIATALFAFIFGLISIGIVLLLTRRNYVSRSVVILSGVVISYLFQAGIMLAKYMSDDDSLREITLWIMGGMWNATWASVFVTLPVVIVCVIFLEKMAIDINTLSSGDEVASNLGVDVQKLRRNGLIISTLVTSVCIAFTGVIGFIGLMAPHICRMMIGNDCRYLLPTAACMGALILLISDTVARVVIRPDDLPVGIIMYVLGGIFFIWMVTSKNWGKRV
ncbi:MAG: iron ABC transporter permease [Candidatus Methanomethylophilaceae archaeon]